MKNYVISLLSGIFVGLVYVLFRVPSPLPPVVVFVGFLGIFLGEKLASALEYFQDSAAAPLVASAAEIGPATSSPVPSLPAASRP